MFIKCINNVLYAYLYAYLTYLLLIKKKGFWNQKGLKTKEIKDQGSRIKDQKSLRPRTIKIKDQGPLR